MDGVNEAFGKITALVEMHGDAAVRLAADVAQTSAISSLVCGAVLGVVAVVGLPRWVRFTTEAMSDRNHDSGKELVALLGSFFIAIGCIPAFVFICGTLLDLGDWRAAFDPQFALARHLMGKL